MKTVVSVSLGSRTRDHEAHINVLGTDFAVRRIGTDGQVREAVRLLKELDGRVDCFGMGGTDLYLVTGSRRYLLREARALANAPRITPIVDGSDIKAIIERKAVEYIRDVVGIPLGGKKVLIVCAVDRFGMAEAFYEAGANAICGDAAFALGIPVWIRSLKTLEAVARVVVPIISWLPIRYLYPSGKDQEVIKPKYVKAYQWADVIAGDCHVIKHNMPRDLSGKIIVTNTITTADREAFKARGVKLLVTTTPRFAGRSFGTNVVQAILVVMSGKHPTELTPRDYEELLSMTGFKPDVEELN